MTPRDRSEDYEHGTAAMLARAQRWLLSEGTAGLSFTLPPLELGVIAPLTPQTIPLLSRTEQGRAFLLALDVATKNQATVMQACAVVRAMGLPVDDWTEAYCAELLKRGGPKN